MCRTSTQLFTAAMITIIAVGCTAQSPNSAPLHEGRSPAISTSDYYLVKLATGSLRLPKSEWKAMTNQYEWAENFEQAQKGPRHEFPRVVTVFKLPMTDDRRAGVRVSPNEYIEMFVVNPGTLTVHVFVDKKHYWVLSRETFQAKSVRGVDTTKAYHSFYDQEFERAQLAFQPELDTTRYLLQSMF